MRQKRSRGAASNLKLKTSVWSTLDIFEQVEDGRAICSVCNTKVSLL